MTQSCNVRHVDAHPEPECLHEATVGCLRHLDEGPRPANRPHDETESIMAATITTTPPVAPEPVNHETRASSSTSTPLSNG